MNRICHFIYWCNLKSNNEGPLNHTKDFIKVVEKNDYVKKIFIYARTRKVERFFDNDKVTVSCDRKCQNSLWFQFKSLFKILSLLKGNKEFVVYFRYTSFLFLPIILKIIGTKNVYIELNGIPNQQLLEGLQFPSLKYIRKKLLFEYDKVLFRKVDGIFTVCNVFKKNISNNYGIKDNVHVVPNGCFVEGIHSIDRDIAKDECGLRRDKKYAIYVGNINTYEGVDFLVKAFVQLACNSKLKDLNLLILGGGIDENYIKSLIPEGLDGRIQLKGYVERKRMYQYIAGSHVGVYTPPTIDYGIDGQRGGSPLKLVDYLSMARPVLVPKSSYYNYVEEFHCGRRYVPENMDSFISQLYKIVEFEDENVLLGNNGRSYSEKYLDWSNTLAPIKKLIRNVCSDDIGCRYHK